MCYLYYLFVPTSHSVRTLVPASGCIQTTHSVIPVMPFRRIIAAHSVRANMTSVTIVTSHSIRTLVISARGVISTHTVGTVMAFVCVITPHAVRPDMITGKSYVRPDNQYCATDNQNQTFHIETSSSLETIGTLPNSFVAVHVPLNDLNFPVGIEGRMVPSIWHCPKDHVIDAACDRHVVSRSRCYRRGYQVGD